MLGRFLSVDPIWGQPKSPQGWNRYAYVLNEPLKYVDLFGLSCTTVDEKGHSWTTDDCVTVIAKDWIWKHLPGTNLGQIPPDRFTPAWKLAWKDFKNEFKDDGCVNVFINATKDALNPLTPSLSSAAEPATFAVAAQKYNTVLRYAASRPNFLGGRGLIYPMRSSVVRAGLADAKAFTASGALVTLDLAIVQGLWAEGRSIATGGCQ
jgi:hypothetical protein